MNNKICEILNIKYPIIQGAMARIADASLASAVSNAGGLGIIASGDAPADIIRKEIKKAKELTNKPFGVNIMLLSPFVEEIVELIIEEDVKVVTTGAGNPKKYIERFKENGIKIMPVVASVALAKRMEKTGADIIIAEGMEAGGHIGRLSTMAMLPQIVDAVNIPVIAAGGIGDGRGMAAAFMLGAKSVQIGTKFIIAKECNVHQNYKDAILKAKDIDTVITGSITGHPVRVLKNKFTNGYISLEREELGKEEVDLKRFEEYGAGRLSKAVIDGDVTLGSVMSGQIAGLIHKEQTCEEIILELMMEYNSIIKKTYENL